MSKRLILLLLPCIVGLCGCSRESGPSDAASPIPHGVDDHALIENCHIIQDAAEEYAGRFGEYPAVIGAGIAVDIQTCVVGEFPDGRMPDGPVSGWVEIQVGTEPIEPGSITYTVIRWEGWNLGYIVVGYGADGPVVTLTSGETHEETVVRVSCLYLRMAVEEFAERSGGEYPVDVGADRTPCGASVMDLLPRGRLCRNPYTGEATVPVGRTPVHPGEIGYTAVDQYYTHPRIETGRRIGYVISGHGESEVVCVINNLDYPAREALVVQNCLTVEQAARRFALNNDGYFPISVSDRDLSRNRMFDYLPGGRFLMNPYTGFCTEPIDGCAAVEGQSGYVVVYCGETMRYCGYCITGAGRNGEIICTLWHGPPEAEGH